MDSQAAVRYSKLFADPGHAHGPFNSRFARPCQRAAVCLVLPMTCRWYTGYFNVSPHTHVILRHTQDGQTNWSVSDARANFTPASATRIRTPSTGRAGGRPSVPRTRSADQTRAPPRFESRLSRARSFRGWCEDGARRRVEAAREDPPREQVYLRRWQWARPSLDRVAVWHLAQTWELLLMDSCSVHLAPMTLRMLADHQVKS